MPTAPSTASFNCKVVNKYLVCDLSVSLPLWALLGKVPGNPNLTRPKLKTYPRANLTFSFLRAPAFSASFSKALASSPNEARWENSHQVPSAQHLCPNNLLFRKSISPPPTVIQKTFHHILVCRNQKRMKASSIQAASLRWWQREKMWTKWASCTWQKFWQNEQLTLAEL